MRKRSTMRTRGHGQHGYALLIVMFLLTLLVLMTIAVAPNVITEARREKETEMVWRGKQYVRGIKRYYMKMHRFPLELDDLTKPKTGIRFMRQAYKDPMNDVDGSWRLIYVGPNGQLIGSLRPQSQNTGGLGVSAASLASSSSSQAFGISSLGGSSSSFANSPLGGPSANSGNSSFGGSSSFGNSSFGGSSSSFGNSSFGSSSFGSGNSFNSSTGSSGFANNPTSPFGPSNPGGDNTDAAAEQQAAAAAANAPTIMGGNIIGVGSKINKKSFRWYEKAKNYLEFEFIWDPTKDAANAMGLSGQQGPGLGTPIGGQNGPSPVSSGSGQNQNQNQNTSPTSPNQPVNNPQEGGPPLQAPPQNQN